MAKGVEGEEVVAADVVASGICRLNSNGCNSITAVPVAAPKWRSAAARSKSRVFKWVFPQLRRAAAVMAVAGVEAEGADADDSLWNIYKGSGVSRIPR
jgi:hypothetical protein